MDSLGVFVSHSSDEAELAITIRDLIHAAFPDVFEVFVSSDERSIPLGEEWLGKVKGALKSVCAVVVLCSDRSVGRQWISFEAGAGWIREIPVILLCHSGMTPGDLPPPLCFLQAGLVSETPARVIPVLARVGEVEQESIDTRGFLEQVRTLEERYQFWDECNRSLSVLARIDPTTVDRLRQGQGFRLSGLSEAEARALESCKGFLEEKEILRISQIGETFGPRSFTYEVCPMCRLSDIMTDPRLQIE